jgi:hypothetical protein
MPTGQAIVTLSRDVLASKHQELFDSRKRLTIEDQVTVIYRISFKVLKFIHLIEREKLISGEMCVTICIVVRGIQGGRVI